MMVPQEKALLLTLVAIPLVGVALLFFVHFKMAIARRAALLTLSFGKNKGAHESPMVVTRVDLMALIEALEHRGVSITTTGRYQDEWLVTEQPSFVISVYSLSPEPTDFLASFGIREGSTIKRLTVSVWLDRLEEKLMDSFFSRLEGG